MLLDDLRANYRTRILALAEKHGAETIRVFGSVVHGNAGEASDVDFLVRMREGTSLLDRGGLYYDLEELLGCKVDVVSERAVSPYLREKVFAEAVSI